MLIQFNFQNYRSFRDNATLDLSATKITEHPHHVTQIGKEKILPIAAIYGANASGKSNICAAFGYMSYYVVESFSFGAEDEQNRTRKVPTPFLFETAVKDKESTFEIYFTDPSDSSNKTYNYGFSVNKDGVTEEWFNTKAQTARKYKRIFYRNTKTIDLSGISKKQRENINVSLEKEVLIASLGAKLKIDGLKNIRNWFLNNAMINFGDPIRDYINLRRLPKGFAEDKLVQKNVLNYLATFDQGITDFIVTKKPSDPKNSEELPAYRIESIHADIDSGEPISIPFFQESAGTQKMFALYPALHDVLETGGVLVIDELDARMHPLLVRNFILTFLNTESNPKHAQLIFVAHNSWQLSNNILRRDEIWFVEKDEKGISHLYSLVEFAEPDGTKIRKDANYEKNYLLGRYGAIPQLEQIIMKES